MATIGSRPERVIGHTGTETRSRLLREAAVGNIGQWAKATQQCRVYEEGLRIVKYYIGEEHNDGTQEKKPRLTMCQQPR